MDSAMKDLNELIGCFEDELNELRRRKDMTTYQKLESLREIAVQLNQPLLLGRFNKDKPNC